ncbi:unnamed protein product [Paramecium octaurelia]|uniref:Tetratricopeptide repeat protein n=1 Tax=Paramecium octaurelia TaxID=43137 RepID=A0A8S1UIV5_PAROT|nr:unnamed protein product [Paramecium octaurelia]
MSYQQISILRRLLEWTISNVSRIAAIIDMNQKNHFKILYTQHLNSLNRYQGAIECFEEVISINPISDSAWNCKGNQLLVLIFWMGIINLLILVKLKEMNHQQEAIEFYNQAISINQKSDSTWFGKGNKLLNKIIRVFIKPFEPIQRSNQMLQ